MSQTTNSAGLQLIESFEGLRLNSYQDSVGVWTIGYGHTQVVRQGQTIIQQQAQAFFPRGPWRCGSCCESSGIDLNRQLIRGARQFHL